MSDDDASDEDRTLTRSEKKLPLSEAVFSVLVTTEDGAEHTLRIDGSMPSPVLIGKSVSCAIRIDDRSVSRRHASLELTDDALLFTDLSSTNGSFLGGTQVMQALLRGGETIRIGGTTLFFSIMSEEAAPARPVRQKLGRLLGGSAAMQRLYPVIERLAASNVPIVLEGETGTGKEMLAETIHELSPLSSGPFVVFDCTTVPPTLLESELFGHERGAFTGATAQRRGLFEQAHGGTLLIDEIGDLDLAMQPKLLRALERGEFRRVGGNEAIHVEVRILCATRRDLDREVAEGRFRDDLFHRLAVARIELPPLRRRTADIPALARTFWSQLGGEPAEFPTKELARWQSMPWPGNVRELRNAIARKMAMGSIPPPALDEDESLDGVFGLGLSLSETRRVLMERFEQRYLERILEQYGGNVTRAAEASGVARRHLQRLRAKGRRSNPGPT
jgi:DNA-binding NtrC family response regulator